VQVDPQSAEAHIALARVYVAAGLKKNAMREVEAAVGLEPQNAAAKSLLKEIKRL
jgi:Tfp pilus assembly protein PilF